MFWFNHPKPFSQKPVAMQVVQRKAAAQQSTDLIIVETKVAVNEAPVAAADLLTPKK